MQIPESRFITISRGEVTAEVSSAEEARHAVKELRLLKRELQRQRRELVRTQLGENKAAKAAAAGGGAKQARTRQRKKAVEPVIDNPLSYVWHSLAAVAAAASGNDASSTSGSSTRPRRKSTNAPARALAQLDRIISSAETCLVQIEARLLSEKAPRAPARSKRV